MSLLRHFGITVANLDESIEFYRDLLGFEVVRIMDEEGEHIDSFSEEKMLLSYGTKRGS
tara:strand:- start:5666 stop:5842 length:177 start_codon:yes stop_codon:yes gene_type:complete